MQVEIKQNWSNGMWWVRPVCADARLVYRQNERDNGMWTNVRVADVMGREWLQAFMHGQHDANAWHVAEVS